VAPRIIMFIFFIVSISKEFFIDSCHSEG
jgi:hypothetical protein